MRILIWEPGVMEGSMPLKSDENLLIRLTFLAKVAGKCCELAIHIQKGATWAFSINEYIFFETLDI